MRNYIISSSLLFASTLFIYNVQSATTGDVTLTTTVANSCSLTQTSSQQTFNLGSLVNPSTGFISPQEQTSQIATLTCNGPSTVSIQSTKGGLKPAGVTNCGTNNCISYNASVQVNGGSFSTSLSLTGAVPSPVTVSTPAVSNVSVMLKANIVGPSNVALAAGTYTDTITITVNPSQT